MSKIIFLGAPGAGKGTYAKILKEEYKIPHISVGDLLREALSKETPIRVQAKEYMLNGQLVPDEIVLELLKERLSQDDTKEGLILDGFPRNIKQAEMLNEISDISKVLNFDVSDEVVLKRLSGRETCKDCGAIFNKHKLPSKEIGICDHCQGELIQREDDKEETILQRLNTYKKQTKPLEEFYNNLGILHTINSNIDLSDSACTAIRDCKKILDRIFHKN